MTDDDIRPGDIREAFEKAQRAKIASHNANAELRVILLRLGTQIKEIMDTPSLRAIAKSIYDDEV